MQKYLIFLLFSTLFMNASNNIFLNTLHEKYNYERNVYKGFKFIDNPKDAKQKEIQEEFLELLPLYLNEENPFYDEKATFEKYYDRQAFIKILTAYAKFESDDEKLKILHEHTLKGLKSFISQEHNLFSYLSIIVTYEAYLTSLSCTNLSTKKMLITHYPLSAKKIYLESMQREENERLLSIEKYLPSDIGSIFNLNEEQSKLLAKQVMPKIKLVSKEMMQNLTLAINDGSKEALQNFLEKNELLNNKNNFSFISSSKTIGSMLLISLNDTLGINKEYFSYLPEVMIDYLKAMAIPPNIEIYHTHQEVLKQYSNLIKNCKINKE